MLTINELILVTIDNKPGFYARIEEILPDVKPGWWQVRLLVLTIPIQVYTWILDEFQLDGAPFTMGGTPIRLDPVVSPLEVERLQKLEEAKKNMAKESGNKVISLQDRRKK